MDILGVSVGDVTESDIQMASEFDGLGEYSGEKRYIYTTVYIGFCDYGFSGQSVYSDRNPTDGPPSLHRRPWV